MLVTFNDNKLKRMKVWALDAKESSLSFYFGHFWRNEVDEALKNVIAK